MRIIKELYSNKCVLHSHTYNNSAQYVAELLVEARKDFPSLDPNFTEVVIYTDSSMGLEFWVPEGSEVPACYQRIQHREHITPIRR